MDFLQKVFNGVFELPLLRNAQERHKKISKIKKKKNYLPHLPSARDTSLSILFFFGAPRSKLLLITKGRQKKNLKKTTNVRTYFIWPGLSFCTRTMT
jgi:hypothetical protein